MKLIDADTVIERMHEVYCKDCDNCHGIKCRACWVDDAIKEIIDTPTIYAVPVRRGKWIRYNGENICSECHKCNFTMTFYCPNCGAKMDGNEKEW